MVQEHRENLERAGQVRGAAERIWLPIVLRVWGCSEPANETRGGACGPLISDMTYYATMASPSDNWDWYCFDMGTLHTIEAWLADIPAGCDFDL